MPDASEVLKRYGIDASMTPDPEIAAKFGKAPGSMAPPAPAPTRGGAVPANVAGILGRYGIDTAEPEPAAKVDDHDPRSKAESFVRGALQGVTFGFGDEIAAAIEAPFSDKTYSQIRDEKRGQNKQAQADNPWTYTGGELAGSVAVPGLGVAKGAAGGVKALATRAAVEGAAAGVGSSEADLTKGDVGGALRDAAVGGGTAAVLGAGTAAALGAVAKKLTRGAESRLIKDIAEEVTTGEGGVKAHSKAARLVRGDAEDIADTLLKKENKPILKLKAAGKIDDAQAFIAQRQDELGTKVREPAYQAFDAQVGGFRVGNLTDKLEAEVEKLSTSPGNTKMKDALNAALRDVRESWGTTVDPGTLGADKLAGAVKEFDPNRMIPTLDLRKFTTGVQESAVDTMGALNETERAKIKNFLRDKVQDVLNEHLDDGAKEHKGLGDVVDRIRDYNTESSALSNVSRSLKTIAEKEQTRTVGMKGLLEQASGKAGYMAAGAASLASGNPLPLLAPLAIKGATKVATKTAQATNMGLAKLMRSALAGNTKAQIMQQAIEEGIPEATALAIAAKWSQPAAETTE